MLWIAACSRSTSVCDIVGAVHFPMATESTKQLLSVLSEWDAGGAKLIRDSGRILSEMDDLLAELEIRERELATRLVQVEERERRVDESLAELNRLARSLRGQQISQSGESRMSNEPASSK